MAKIVVFISITPHTVVSSIATALTFKLDKIIPFGVPVVPPLCNITAGSSPFPL